MYQFNRLAAILVMCPKFMTAPKQYGCCIVIAGCLVIAGLTRNPVVAWHWIPDQVRDDKLDVRDDKLDVRDGRVFLCAHHD